MAGATENIKPWRVIKLMKSLLLDFEFANEGWRLYPSVSLDILLHTTPPGSCVVLVTVGGVEAEGQHPVFGAFTTGVLSENLRTFWVIYRISAVIIRNVLLPVAHAQRNKSKEKVETGYFMFWLYLLKYLFVWGNGLQKIPDTCVPKKKTLG